MIKHCKNSWVYQEKSLEWQTLQKIFVCIGIQMLWLGKLRIWYILKHSCKNYEITPKVLLSSWFLPFWTCILSLDWVVWRDPAFLKKKEYPQLPLLSPKYKYQREEQQQFTSFWKKISLMRKPRQAFKKPQKSSEPLPALERSGPSSGGMPCFTFSNPGNVSEVMRDNSGAARLTVWSIGPVTPVFVGKDLCLSASREQK